jgi:hypothetical protein
METNKIIAVFMGFEDESRILGGGQRMRRKTEWKYGCQQYEQYGYDQLKYHSDWNWLMPVVEKIESMGFDVNILNNGTQIIDYSKNIEVVNNVADISFDRKIEHTYQAIITFVSEIRD